MNRTAQGIRLQLEREGFWRGPAPRPQTPWYVQLLTGMAAWLAACLLLPVFTLVFLVSLIESGGSMVLAVLVCAGGCVLMRLRPGGVFLGQLGTAVVLAGLALAVVSSFEESSEWVAVVLLALVSYAAGPVYINRVACALVAAGMLALHLAPGDDHLLGGSFNTALVTTGLAWLAALLWQAETWSSPARARWLEPGAWAFSLSASVLVWFFDFLPLVMAPAEFEALGTTRLLAGGACALLPLVCWVAVTFVPEARYAELPAPRARVLVGGLLLLLIPVFVTAPGVAIGLAWLILGMAHSRLSLLALGVAAILAYVARYYYLLHLPLLHKAGWLALAGALLLLAAWALARTTWRAGR